MRDGQNSAERQVYRQRIRQYSERLARAARDPRCPDVVIGLVTWHLMQAAFGLCGDAIRNEFFLWLAARRREGFDLCSYCGSPKSQPQAPMCPTCLRDAERAMLEGLAVDGPVQ